MNPKQPSILPCASRFNKWFLRQIFLIALFFFGITSGIFSQTNVTGKITNEEGVGIPQASVTEKGKKSGTTTADDGSFNLSVKNPNTSLVVSSVGFVSKEVPLNGKASLDVSLKSGNTKMEEVVVVGYGTQKKVTVTGAVAQVKGSDLAQ
jgi:hypothetical protein